MHWYWLGPEITANDIAAYIMVNIQQEVKPAHTYFSNMVNELTDHRSIDLVPALVSTPVGQSIEIYEPSRNFSCGCNLETRTYLLYPQAHKT